MNFRNHDHAFAVITPGLLLAFSYFSSWGAFFLTPLLYFIYRHYTLQCAKDTTLKLFDLSVSIVLIAAVLAAFLAGLQVVARDGEFTIPLVSSGILIYVLVILSGVYYLGCVAMLTLRTYQHRPYTPKLSMGIFEALRGKRVASE